VSVCRAAHPGAGGVCRLGGVAGSLIEARLQPWSLCFPRSDPGPRLGLAALRWSLDPGLKLVMGLVCEKYHFGGFVSCVIFLSRCARIPLSESMTAHSFV
jgi:hypothetical protein